MCTFCYFTTLHAAPTERTKILFSVLYSIGGAIQKCMFKFCLCFNFYLYLYFTMLRTASTEQTFIFSSHTMLYKTTEAIQLMCKFIFHIVHIYINTTTPHRRQLSRRKREKLYFFSITGAASSTIRT